MSSVGEVGNGWWMVLQRQSFMCSFCVYQRVCLLAYFSICVFERPNVQIFNIWLAVSSCFIVYMCLCPSMQVCMSIFVSTCYFFSFLLLQRCNHILALTLWQLVGMHIVIKQFPVCKCPVYTFLLQSLSLDRLLEYEESSYTMKNENSKTSIKIYCDYSQP